MIYRGEAIRRRWDEVLDYEAPTRVVRRLAGENQLLEWDVWNLSSNRVPSVCGAFCFNKVDGCRIDSVDAIKTLPRYHQISQRLGGQNLVSYPAKRVSLQKVLVEHLASSIGCRQIKPDLPHFKWSLNEDKVSKWQIKRRKYSNDDFESIGIVW